MTFDPTPTNQDIASSANSIKSPLPPPRYGIASSHQPPVRLAPFRSVKLCSRFSSCSVSAFASTSSLDIHWLGLTRPDLLGPGSSTTVASLVSSPSLSCTLSPGHLDPIRRALTITIVPRLAWNFGLSPLSNLEPLAKHSRSFVRSLARSNRLQNDPPPTTAPPGPKTQDKARPEANPTAAQSHPLQDLGATKKLPAHPEPAGTEPGAICPRARVA